MDEITELMDKLETYEPTKTIQELAREFPHVPGIRLLASMEAEAMTAQSASSEATPNFCSSASDARIYGPVVVDQIFLRWDP